ncbi:guanylate-binding protein 6-like [Stylophora pistillata]|uniref:guanylate-binding protein 6-like n=1 Tax=Stylophora pistillata TaxID=50429 RepID=UPI000C0508AA|nr:guanylate-binding protein 6-like [Stylophora pistillata]
MASWSAYQTESEEEALAKAMQLSLMGDEKSLRKEEFQVQRSEETPDGKQPSREAPLSPSSTYQRQLRREEVHLVQSAPGGGTRRSAGHSAGAIPLCLPNNYQWNSRIRQCVKTEEKRSSLYFVEETLQELRKVKGPVCTVSIAGPYRKGKSYILSQIFDQPEVFPLGHKMVAETMGIWMWIVPEKYKDTRGREITVVLLDSEGIDAASGAGRDDNQIFTLTVLLASILIYNSSGVPTRRDLEGLDFISKLSGRIHAPSDERVESGTHMIDFVLHIIFLECKSDIRLSIDGCFIKVFRDEDSGSGSQHSRQVAEGILGFFPGFEAFSLPLPTADEEIMRTISVNKDQLQTKFLRQLEDFKRLVKSILVPKHSYTEGELVTGEGLAALVTQYVDAINTPGFVPNVQGAWDLFVETKCFETKKTCERKYCEVLTLLLSEILPCDNDEIRAYHNSALEETEELFLVEMIGISTNTVEKQLRQLKLSLNRQLDEWQTKNSKLTKEGCENLLLELKKKHLDPIIEQLEGRDGSKLAFDDILRVYRHIKDDYDAKAKGAKDVIAAAFADFHPKIAAETKQYIGILRQLKDFDEHAARDKAAEAYRERERRRLEEERMRLEQENQEQEKEMKMLITRLEEERAGMLEKMGNEMEQEKEQLQNMREAGLGEAKLKREAFIEENHALEERLLEMQEKNEEHMKMMKRLSEMIAKHQREKIELREQLKELPQEEIEESLKELIRKQSEEENELLKKMDICADDNQGEVPQMMASRAQMVADIKKRMEENEEEQESLVRIVLRGIAKVGPTAGKLIALYPPAAPYAEKVADGIAGVAGALSEVECVIM